MIEKDIEEGFKILGIRNEEDRRKILNGVSSINEEKKYYRCIILDSITNDE